MSAPAEVRVQAIEQAELQQLLADSDRTHREEYRRLAERATSGPKDVVLQKFGLLLDIIEHEVFERSRHPRTEEGILDLLNALDALEVFREASMHLAEGTEIDVLAEVQAELHGLRPLESSAEQAAMLRDLVEGRLLLRVQALAATPPSRENPGSLVRVINSARSSLRPGDPSALAPRLTEAKSGAWRSVELVSSSLEGRDLENFLRRLRDDLVDHAEDTIAHSETLPPEQALTALLWAEQDLDATARLMSGLKISRRRREIWKTRSKLRAVREERIVRDRMRGLLGPRGLRSLDIAIFTTICILLLILAWQTFGAISPRTEEALDRIDIVLCCALLCEFGWRFFLSGFHPRYFGRHILTDVVPSFPPVQWLRVVRPLVQGFRLWALTFQSLDRFVRRHAGLLNRNFVLFDTSGADEVGDPTPHARLQNLQDRALKSLRVALSAQDPLSRSALIDRRYTSLHARLLASPIGNGCHIFKRQGTFRDFRVESLIERMVTLDEATVQEVLGQEDAQRWVRCLRIFDVPILRRIPLIRHVAPGSRKLEPGPALVRAGRNAGRVIEGWVDRIRAIADLQGVVTGSQLLDRIGSALVKATQRPAVRLILFGFLVVLISGLVGLFGASDQSFIAKLNRSLRSVLGTPLLVLGGICLVIQAFGRWIRSLAGEATDYLQKVSEAHGVDLLKFQKHETQAVDLGSLFDRALGPELWTRTEAEKDTIARERANFTSLQPHMLRSKKQETALPGVRDQVLHFYLDYLDAAILHWSNVKSTEQFLGNLDLEAIRLQRLGCSKKELAQLKRLDLERERPLPTGAYLWFTFITESLAQKTAKLVLEYNRYTIPLSHRKLVPSGAIAEMQAWIASGRDRASRPRPVVLGAGHRLGAAQFSALDFLENDADRDSRIAAEFGSEVLQRLADDRRALIRSVFSSYPCENWPRHRRTLNPYAIYFRWVGRGRVIILPVRLLIGFIRGVGRTIAFLSKVIREQLRPTELKLDAAAHAHRDAALRKLNRMHRPLFLAALELRARFDPEYQGASLAQEPLPGNLASLREDLDLIGAREHERERLRSKQQEALALCQKLKEFLDLLGAGSKPLEMALEPEGVAGSSGSPREAQRAVLVAYLIDYSLCRSLLTAHAESEESLEQWLLLPPRTIRRRRNLNGFEAWLKTSRFEGRSAEEKARLRGAYSSNFERSREKIDLLCSAGGVAAAHASARAVLAQVARYPAPWSQQLVSLRTIQSMTRLDLVNARRVVTQLAGFEE